MCRRNVLAAVGLHLKVHDDLVIGAMNPEVSMHIELRGSFRLDLCPDLVWSEHGLRIFLALEDLLCIRLSREPLPLIPLETSITISPDALPVSGSSCMLPRLRVKVPWTVCNGSCTVKLISVLEGSSSKVVALATAPAMQIKSPTRFLTKQPIPRTWLLHAQPAASRKSPAQTPFRATREDAARVTGRATASSRP